MNSGALPRCAGHPLVKGWAPVSCGGPVAAYLVTCQVVPFITSESWAG
jgi:hypothetical protein